MANKLKKLWHDRKFRLRKDKVLFALDVIKSIWVDQSSSSDIVMPKYLAPLTWLDLVAAHQEYICDW